MTSNGLPTPDEVKASIVLDDDDICTALRKMIKSFHFAYIYLRYKYNDTGGLSDKYCAEIKKCVASATSTGAT
jgi:hypothetical protein